MKNYFIFNFPSHYRYLIYSEIDKSFDCEFYWGDSLPSPIKRLDDRDFQHPHKDVRNHWFGNWFYQSDVVKLVSRKEKANYVITGDPRCLSTWIALFLIMLHKNKRSYLWTHGWYGRESIMEKLIKKSMYKLVDGIFLYGDYAKNLMIQNGVKSSKLHVIANSLDYYKQLEIRKSLKSSALYSDHFKNDNHNLFFIGRLTDEKKLDMTIKALAELRKEGLFFNMTFIGGGTEETKLKELTGHLGLENCVWFYGPCYKEEELAELISNADLCVSPGNVGLTAIHSLSYGTPVLTHDNFAYQGPEFEAITPNETGLFFKENDLTDLCEKIKEWFRMSKGRTRKTISDKCHEVVDSKYNPGYQVKVLHSVLDK
ncbi:MAG: glycosyltransferase [Bacteroidales bacterium]|nr:glycosyltransferase [Bacteroidales bacterium]